MSDDASDTMTFDDAAACLPDGDDIHTFMGGGIGMIGADWRRESVLDAMRASPDIRVTGPMAQAMKHGLAIKHPRSDAILFIATTRRTDEFEAAALPPKPETTAPANDSAASR